MYDDKKGEITDIEELFDIDFKGETEKDSKKEKEGLTDSSESATKKIRIDELVIDQIFERKRKRRKKINLNLILKSIAIVFLIVMSTLSYLSLERSKNITILVEVGEDNLVKGLSYIEGMSYDNAKKYLRNAYDNFTRALEEKSTVELFNSLNVLLILYDLIMGQRVYHSIQYVHYMAFLGNRLSLAGIDITESLLNLKDAYYNLINKNSDQAQELLNKIVKHRSMIENNLTEAIDKIRAIPTGLLEGNYYQNILVISKSIMNISLLNEDIGNLYNFSTYIIASYLLLTDALRYLEDGNYSIAKNLANSAQEKINALSNILQKKAIKYLLPYKIAIQGAIYYLNLAIESVDIGCNKEIIYPYYSYAIENMTLVEYELSIISG
ncbi:MAG: hypothetical protein ACTSU6_02050 [Candidatus Njordarchaeales archaeon]